MVDNIKLYPWFHAASGIEAWIPVFFLYFSQYLSLEQVIQLSAIYYVSVFVLEVPSGYFSDRIGRKITLCISVFSLVCAHILFLSGDSFIVFALGQFMLAAGIAFQSGTDTALHYDSLAVEGLEHEYEQREARAEKYGLFSLAIASLVGGALATIDLRLAYVLSLCGSLVTLSIVIRFTEPRHILHSDTGSFISVLTGCIRLFRNPLLAWLFVAMVVMYAMEHVPFEFYQPYIRLLEFEPLQGIGDSAALISGIVIAVSMFGGAIGAGVSIRLRKSLGLLGVLGLAALIQLSIVMALGMVLHIAALMMVFIRNFPMAMVHAPVHAAIAPLITSAQRATYLSLQGLSQRIFFALLLFALSRTVSDVDVVDWPTLSRIIQICLLIGLLSMIPMALFSTKIRSLIRKTGG